MTVQNERKLTLAVIQASRHEDLKKVWCDIVGVQMREW